MKAGPGIRIRRAPITIIAALAVAFAATPLAAQIGVAKDAAVSGREVTLDFYLESFGVTTLNPVTLADDLDAAFGAGTYTVTSGPALVAGAGTLVLNGSFDGSADAVLVSGGTLAPGATAQVRIVVEITAVTNQGFGLGIYYNQAAAQGDGGAFSDLSDDGTDPDPDGNGDPTGADEDDPTLIDLTENPVIGVAKAATLSGSEVTFDFYLESFGNRDLSSLTLPDDLDAVFGAGNYSVTTGPTLIDDPGTITVNGSFDGSGDVDLITSGSLAVGDTARIRIVVDVTTVTDRGAGFGAYSNQVTAAAVSPSGTPTSDLSDAGVDPDPARPDADDPTVFVIGEEPVLGVAKNAAAAASDVTFDYYLENLGAVALATLSLADDLDAVFGAGNYAVTSGPTFVDDPGTITLNALFDGSLETALVSAGTLAAGDTAQIRVVVHVLALADLGSGLGVYQNQVTAAGTTAAGAVTSDLSDAGTDPDPSGDGDPTGAGEDDPTAFAVAQNPVVGAAKTAVVVRLGVNYQIFLTLSLTNLGNVQLTNVSLTDDLDAVFGAGNYDSVTDPFVSLGGGGSLPGNTSFNGSTNTELLAAGGTMAPGAFATIEVALRLTNVTDQGFGVGVYHNQATASADGPATDLSDSGVVPDPDGDGNPSEAGEDDPTVISVGTYLGAAKNAMVSGNVVTFDFYLEAFGTETISNVELSESLDDVFGPGNYTVTSGPSLVDDPGTLAVNPDFNGSSDAELIAPGGSLAAGDTAQVQIMVTIERLINGGTGLGSYTNQVQAVGETSGGTLLTDFSHAGTDPDPNGDGNPTGENAPTVFAVAVDPIVGVAKDAAVSGTQVTLDFYLESFGTLPSGELSLVDDLDAVFGAGNYAILTGPTFIDDPGTLVLNGAYDGSGDPQLLAAGSTLNAGDTAQIRVVADVTAVTDQGFGSGVYQNQATLTGSDASGLVYSDLSDSGTDPDPDGNGDPTHPATDDDPTIIVIGPTQIAISKHATVDGTDVTLDFYIENVGDVEVSALYMEENLDAVFGSGNFSILSSPQVIEGAGTIFLNSFWNGMSSLIRRVLISGGSLVPGALARIRTVVRVTNVTDQGDGLGVYSNQVTISGEGPDGTPTADDSDAGIVPDTDGDGDPTEAGEDDPTPIIIGEEAILGVAKDAVVAAGQVTFDYYLENLGNVTLGTLDLEDDLDAVFGAGNYSLNGAPSLVDDPGTLILDPAYDGSASIGLIAAGSTLAAGDTAWIRLVVDVLAVVDQGLGRGSYENQVLVSGLAPLGSVAMDLSDFGVDPDPDGNGDPGDVGESDPTTFTVSNVAIGAAKTAAVAGRVVTLDYYVENLGNETLSEISLPDDLDAVFGAGTYQILSGPTLVTGVHDLTPNPGFNGSSDTDLVVAGGSIVASGLEQIRVVVQVNVLTDHGSGLGVYSNQVTVSAEDPGGSPLSDLSDAGTNPDPDGDGDASEAGEDDPTVFSVAEDPTVGVAKTASVTGGTVTLDFFLESFADVTAGVALADDLDAVFGAGNYTVTSGPSLIVNPGTLVANGGFNGSGDTALLAGGSTLSVGAVAQLRVVVRVVQVTDRGSGLGVYQNQASLTAAGPVAAVAADLSDAGTDPDPDGDGNPDEAGENDPTVFMVAENPTVGAAKTVSVTAGTVTFDYYLENLGNVGPEVALTDDLDAVFGAGNYTVTSGPALIVNPGTLVVNGAFNGSGDSALLSAGSTLAVGATAQLRVVVEVTLVTDQGSGLGGYQNQAGLTATGPGATVATDTSDAGTDPDPDGDGNPDEAGENDPTVFMVAENPTVGAAKTASVAGQTVTFDLYLENLGNVAADVTLTDDLDAVFGAGNYTVTSAPALIVNPGTVTANGGFDGSGDTALLAAGGTLAVGATAQVRVAVEVTTLIDQGLGAGVYANQAGVAAIGPGGTPAADLSDAGTDPDPNGNGDPADSGENDPTSVVLADTVPPRVTGVATVAGALAECDTVRQPITRLEVSIADDLSPIANADAASSYLLVEAGPDADFSTLACGAAAGDDVEIGIVGVSLMSVDPVIVDVDLGLGAGLDAGLYRFFVCDTVADDFGNALDGDGDTVAGGDFVVPFFRADPGNQLVNGHFDDCPVSLDPWLQVTAAPNTIEPGGAGTDDYQASPLSASARVSHSVDDTSSLAQCVAVVGGATYDIESRLRFDAPLGATALYSRTCELFAGAGCTGASLATSTNVSLAEDSGGVWETFTRPIAVPAGARSALCDFTVEAAGSDPSFDVLLDGLRLVGPEAPIFADGFESGNTSAWSLTVP